MGVNRISQSMFEILGIDREARKAIQPYMKQLICSELFKDKAAWRLIATLVLDLPESYRTQNILKMRNLLNEVMVINSKERGPGTLTLSDLENDSSGLFRFLNLCVQVGSARLRREIVSLCEGVLHQKVNGWA